MHFTRHFLHLRIARQQRRLAFHSTNASRGSSSRLCVGDLVEIQRSHRFYLGLVVQDTLNNNSNNNNNNSQLLLRLSNGHTISAHPSATNILIRHPQFTNTLESPDISKELLRFSSSLQRLISSCMPHMDTLYSTLISSSKQTITLSEASNHLNDLLIPPSNASQQLMRHAALHLLLKHNTQFSPLHDDIYRLATSETFRIRSQEEHQRLCWAHEQSKGNLPAFKDFISKCTARIANPASSMRDIPFTSDDLIFLKLAENAIRFDSLGLKSFEYLFAHKLLLKSVNPLKYGTTRDTDIMIFLKQVGYHSLWFNTRMLQPLKRGSLYAFNNPVSAHLESVSNRVSNSPSTSELEAARTDIDIHHRHQLTPPTHTTSIAKPVTPRSSSFHPHRTVFVIDDPNAQELDDGISVEPVSRSVAWIHVHVADPTEHLHDPMHPIAQAAQLRGNTIYTPERFHPLLPCTLNGNPLDLKASPFALTFSAKIDLSNGSILDYKVEPTMLGPTQIIHYDSVDSILQNETPSASFSEELRQLQRACQAHLTHRVSQGAIVPDYPSSSISISPYPLLHGKPTITLTPFKAPHLSASKTMVQEAMIIAGRVAAKFCQEHALPVPYRGQPPPLSINESEVQSLVSQRDPINGILPLLSSRRLIAYMSPGKWSLDPSEHFSMGLQSNPNDAFTGYVKATSPLRRYKDMLVHWQIKSTFNKSKSTLPAPFTSSDISKLMVDLDDIHLKSRELSKACDKYWILEWIRRREISHQHSLEVSNNQSMTSGIPMPTLPIETLVREWSFNPTTMRREKQPTYTAMVESRHPRFPSMLRVVLIELNGIVTNCKVPMASNMADDEAIIPVVIDKVDPTTGQVYVSSQSSL